MFETIECNEPPFMANGDQTAKEDWITEDLRCQTAIEIIPDCVQADD